jgi:ATP-binding cassette, subfamily B, bacterial
LELTEPLPDELNERVRKLLAPEEEVLLAVATDIVDEHRYGERWLVMTPQRVMVLSANGDGNSHLTTEVPVKPITAAKAEGLVGNGSLEVTCDGRTVELLRYSSTLAKKFAAVARAVEKVAKEERMPSAEELIDHSILYCRTCKRPLPEWSDGICPDCMNRSRTVVRLLTYLRPYRTQALISLALAIAAQGVDLVPPYLSKLLVDDVLHVETMTSPARNMAMLWEIVLALLGLRLIGSLFSARRQMLMAWMGGRVLVDIRQQLYACMQRLQLRFFDRKQTGNLISRVSNDTQFLYFLVVDGFQDFVINGLQIIGIGIVLFWMNWRLALLILVPIPLIVIVTLAFIQRIHSVYHRLWHRFGAMSSLIGDALSGIRMVKAFAQEEREMDRFGRRNHDVFEAGWTAERTWATMWPVMMFVSGLGSLLVWLYGGHELIQRAAGGSAHTTLGTLIAFNVYLAMFYSPIQSLARMNNWIQRALTAAERTFEVLDSEPETYDAPDAVDMPNMRGDVEFRDVSFGYDKMKMVIQNLTVKVDAGHMCGLVGHSGAGKSTMINLICRFYDVAEGQILIDGVDIRKIKLKDLRRQIGVVPQDSFLFSGTIAENISYGKPDATREEVIRAAIAANAHDFILKQPDGYDTNVGERGGRLSGGERQRIAIARAILHNPRILILDEATASVDTETERQIQEALARLVENRTTFAIAHRLSTLREADYLLVLENGKKVEFGSHDELMEQRGAYYKLVQMQQELSKIKAVDG